MSEEGEKAGLPELTRPRGPARDDLERQVTEGDALRGKFGRAAPATLKEKCRLWRDYTRDLLTTLFDDVGPAREFESAASPSLVLGADVATDMRLLAAAVDRGLSNLRSLLRRLELFPAPEPKLRGPKSKRAPGPKVTNSRSIFLVHGHDEGTREGVARFLERLDLDVTILHEKPSEGRTIIEKLEAHADVRYAVVLLTPDDVGYAIGREDDARPRARQNVILELGYFMGALGRAKVVALHTGGIELPSDMAGVLYIPLDPEGAWHLKLASEIKAAGIEIDLNEAL